MFWTKAREVSQRAMENETLVPIASKAFYFESEGYRCFGHTLSDNIRKKPVAHFSDTPKAVRNPFLPYEKAMYVSEAGDDHVCILNKFPVITPHLLICTRQYAQQNQLLDLSDFTAWLMAFRFEPNVTSLPNESHDADDVLGFFNGGVMAGSSQPHRHMQVVKSQIPFEQAIANGELPFPHQLSLISELNPNKIHQGYLEMMSELHLLPEHDNGICKPYNLLLTKRWMLIVPRSVNQVGGMYANGINFSGRFVVKNEAQLQWLKQNGVLAFLGQCT